VADRLEALLDQLEPRSPYYAPTIWLLGFAHDERWTEYGDPADRDAAIQRLTEALGAGPRFAVPEPEIHATLAQLHMRCAAERDGVGSRWEIPDSATSLLMFMFHLRVARYGDSPRDALRLAQLWLLNPDRKPPEEMPGELAQRARRLRLRDITAWAGFVHQGR
jgi:hypothetical protein